jgi:hypothetical protein
MRIIPKSMALAVLALALGVSGALAARTANPAATERLDPTTRHIRDLRHKDPKVRAKAAKDLGCS